MNHWIFVVTSHREHNLEGREILETRLKDAFWGLGKGTPNRKSLQSGDKVVFYVGDPEKAFAATAVLSSANFAPSEKERGELSHGKAFYSAEFGVRLDKIELWEKPRKVEEIVRDLRFIENKEKWGPYFQGGVRGITEEDYRMIVQGVPQPISSTSQPETDAKFALESHLEEFIDRNWGNIDFGEPLVLFSTDEQSGRQFPAGSWSIDFLCSSPNTGDFVVIELKRGKSSDSTVGQVLRYMSWVKENLATSKQDVRGIIIAQEVDEALRYAAKNLPNVNVLTYSVDFSLLPYKK
jgi:hypothetical protein